eukprot:3189133-Rhodomonas_salina.2
MVQPGRILDVSPGSLNPALINHVTKVNRLHPQSSNAVESMIQRASDRARVYKLEDSPRTWVGPQISATDQDPRPRPRQTTGRSTGRQRADEKTFSVQTTAGRCESKRYKTLLRDTHRRWTMV